ncbi:MAG TPA: PilN domain-containing protein, partial [Bryobacteraceae bacterium]|nr:PilN domain-containing protein [Bryobacteraceae bacterium]
AAAVAGAVPRLALSGNLLPADQRRTDSRVRLIPTFALGFILVVLAGALAAHSSYADARYLAVLQSQIAKYEPQARRVDSLDRRVADTRSQSQSLDEFRYRSKLDMDTLRELNRLIPPPGWIQAFDLDRKNIMLFGEVEQAAVLLKVLDESPYFERSEFVMPIARGNVGELFRIRTLRQTPPAVSSAGPAK